jgi:hypothetical protein
VPFGLSRALAYPVVQKGFLRASRKWMNLMPEKFKSVVASRVYLLTSGPVT